MDTNKPELKQTWQQDLLMRGIKIIDIGYIYIIYFIITICLAILADRILGTFDPILYKNTPDWKIGVEILLTIWIFGILFYIMRNVIEIIPFPLDGYKGFSHTSVKELENSWIFHFIFLTCCTNIKDRLTYFYKRYITKDE